MPAEPAAEAVNAGLRIPVGVLLPSSNTCVEPDFYRMGPPGVTTHSARLYGTETTADGVGGLTKDLDLAVRQLASADVRIIAFACTTGSLLYGAGYDRELAARIEKLSDTTAVTTSTAVLEAFHALGIQSVAVGTPYLDELNERVAGFLEDNGIRVVNLRGLQIRRNTDIGRQSPSVAYELGREVDRPEADAVFLSCTDLRGAEVAERLEADLGKPVVASNQATLWAVLCRLGIEETVPGHGRLLREPRSKTSVPV